MSPPAQTLADQQRAFDAFRRVSDEERPHEALGQRPPASRYAPSSRPYPGRAESPEYAAGVEVRRVRSNGEIKWAGERVFLSEALIGEPVGLVRRDDRLLDGPVWPLGDWAAGRLRPAYNQDSRQGVTMYPG